MFKGGMASMMQKAQKMQESVKVAQQEIKNFSVVGKSGNEVTLQMNGDYQVSGIEINDAILSDKELLQDMLMMAINDATTQIKSFSEAKMKDATGGISLPL